MYSILKFIDYVDYKRLRGDSHSAIKSIKLEDVDPILRKLYFNPDCLLQLILEHLCAEVQIDIGHDYDLCTESGVLLGVKDYQPTTPGTEVFGHKESYFFAILKRSLTGQIEEVRPLVGETPSGKAIMKLLCKQTTGRRSLRRLSSGRKSVSNRSQVSLQSSSKSSARKRSGVQ